MADSAVEPLGGIPHASELTDESTNYVQCLWGKQLHLSASVTFLSQIYTLLLTYECAVQSTRQDAAGKYCMSAVWFCRSVAYKPVDSFQSARRATLVTSVCHTSKALAAWSADYISCTCELWCYSGNLLGRDATQQSNYYTEFLTEVDEGLFAVRFSVIARLLWGFTVNVLVCRLVITA